MSGKVSKVGGAAGALGYVKEWRLRGLLAFAEESRVGLTSYTQYITRAPRTVYCVANRRREKRQREEAVPRVRYGAKTS